MSNLKFKEDKSAKSPMMEVDSITGMPTLIGTKRHYSQYLIRTILHDLNTHNYSNLDSYLKNTDWFSILPEDIVPRLEVRTFVKDIKDDETRLYVMKFLLKYADYYFSNISKLKPFLGNDSRSGDLSFGIQQVVTASIDDFCRELTILIDQQEISRREKPDVSETITQLQKENDLLKDQLRKANEKITRQKRQLKDFKAAAIEMNVKYNALQSVYEQLSKQLGIPVPTIVQGDLIHGEKHVGAHIDNVESGGIGSQIK